MLTKLALHQCNTNRENPNIAASIKIIKARILNTDAIIVTGISAKTARMTALTELALHTLGNMTQIQF